jgi:hypothetical protein
MIRLEKGVRLQRREKQGSGKRKFEGSRRRRRMLLPERWGYL